MINIRALGALLLLALSTMTFAQDSYSTVGSVTANPANVNQLPQRNRGGLTFYTDQAAFEADASGLDMENFASSNVGPANVCSDFPPLNSATNDACYASGDLLPGFTGNVTGAGSGQYVLLTSGFFPGMNVDVVGPNSFADDFDITFDDANAIAFDMYNPFNPITVDLEFFNGATSLGTTQVAGDASGVFFGVISDQPITQITMVEGSGGGELIGDMQFGSVAGCEVSAISVDNDGNVTISGDCPDGECVYVWASTSCNLSVVDSSNATFLGCVEPGTTNLGFFEDSCYYAADDAGNVLAVSSQTVPTLGEFALIAFATLLMLAGMVYMRKRRLA